MTRRLALVLVLAALELSIIIMGRVDLAEATGGDSWTQRASMHIARSGLGVAVVDGKIYAIGGSTERGENVNIGGIVGSNEEYDLKTDTWTSKAPLPTPRAYLALVAYQGRIYCLGGISAYDTKEGVTVSRANEVYDPSTDTWTTKTPIPIPRGGQQASLIDDKIYLMDFVLNGSQREIVTQIYHPATDSWTTQSSVPLGVISDVSAVIDKKIYFTDANEAKMEIFDAQTNNWSFGTSPPSAVYQGAAGATSGAFAPTRIYFLGLQGYMDQGAMPNRVYNPKNDSWSLGVHVPTNRKGFAVAVVNDIIYVIGGYSSTFPYPGDTIEIKTQSAATEAYTPIDYGTPDPAYRTPTPEPSTSLSNSSTSTPSTTQTLTSSPTTQPTKATSDSTTATQTLSPSIFDGATGDNSVFQTDLFWASTAAVTIAIISAVAFVTFRLRKRRATVAHTYIEN